MTLLRDIRFGLRLLKRNLGFSSVAVLTLALGVAATTAIFSVVYGTFFAPLPYREADRLVMVWEQEHGQRRPVSGQSYVDWKRGATSFAAINAWGGGSYNLSTDDRPESVTAGQATPGFLEMLGYGYPLTLGRTFVEEEGIPGRDKVVVLTYQLWKERFGGDVGIVGRQVRIDGLPYTVVGVLGQGPADQQQNKIWIPLALTEESVKTERYWLNVMARLKDGVDLPRANAEMAALSATLERERAVSREGWSTSVEAFRNDFVRDSTKRGIWLLLGAVSFLLLIACANVANLLLARGTSRQRELAIRTSMGASGGAIVRQLLVESLVLALAGGALGALMAAGVIDAIVALMPAYTLPSEAEITLSVPVLIFALVVCTLAGLLAGCAPAWQAARTSPAEVMKEGGRGVAGGRHGLRRALVVLEFALALTLLVGGGMTVSALVRTMNVDLGFRAERLMTFDLPIARGRLASAEAVEAFYRQFLDRASAVPGVASIAISTGMPIEGASFGRDVDIPGRSFPEHRPGAGINMVTPGYYRTFGIPLKRGRVFTERDRAGSQPVVIVNETFVKLFLTGVDPIGQRVIFPPFAIGQGRPPSDPVQWEIVGVRANVANAGPGREAYPEIDIPFWQTPWPRVTVAVHTSGDTSGVQSSMADILRKLDPELPMSNVRTIEQTLTRAMADDRFYTVFFAAFAAVALVLAGIGIYGVMSFAVAQRRHEIGVRMALGAARRQVLGQVLREGMLTAGVGTAAGAIGAALVGRALSGAVFGIESSSPLTFVAVALVLLAAAFLACLVPARRAASVDPMVALRQD